MENTSEKWQSECETDEYDDLYYEIQNTLELKEWSYDELFDNFQKQCVRIFEIGEADYGKKAKNLPNEYLDEIEGLYSVASYRESTCYKEPSKYDPDFRFSDCKELERISKYNLAQIILENGKLFDLDAMNSEIEKISADHIKDFFGIEYSDKFSDQERYEILQLIKVLYNCKNIVGVDLAYLKRISLLRFKHYVPSSYQAAILFIKRELSKQLSFMDILKLEYLNSTFRNCVKVLTEGVVEYQVNQFAWPDCGMQQAIRKNIYTVINLNLKKIDQRRQEEEKARGISKKYEMPIFCRAYLHFIELGINDVIESLKLEDAKSKQGFDQWMVIKDKIYADVDELIRTKFIMDLEMEISEIKDFAKENSEEIVKIYTQMVKTEHSDKVRVKKSYKDYEMMAYIYNFSMGREQNASINIRKILLLIYLYEKCKMERIIIPQFEGYRRNKSENGLKIQPLMKKLSSYNQNSSKNFLDGKEEYMYSVYWLIHRMHMIMNYKNIELDKLERELKTNLLKFLQTNISIANDDCKYKSVNDIANALISERELQYLKTLI